MLYHEFRAMNSDILLAARGDPASVSAGFEQAQAYIEAAEQRFTRFSELSELSELNRNFGRWFQVSKDLFELVWLAWNFHQETGGLFNPAILEALTLAGYDRSMDEIRGRILPFINLPERVNVPDFQQVQFNKAERKICLPAGMQVDLGGIAKGWIAEQAARVLGSYSDACAVSAGGDMYMVGLPEEDPSWEVALEDPRDPSQVISVLRVGPGAVATSSIVKRRWKQGDHIQHHLIDPRSGEPAVTDWLSVTVIAAHAAEAEVFAKALLIAGPQGVDELAPRDWENAFIAVDRDGNLWGSANSVEFIDVINEFPE